MTSGAQEAHSWWRLLSPARVGASAGELAAAIGADWRLRIFVTLVILGDLAIVLLHLGHWLALHDILTWDALRDPALYMKNARSYAAFCGFAMIGVVIAVAGWRLAALREPVYAGIAIVFLVVLGNAVLGLHLIFGDWIEELLDIEASYPKVANYIGEAIGFAVIGLTSLVVLLLTSYFSTARHAAVGILIALTLAALALFDGAFDLVHALELLDAKWFGDLLVVIEEAGELASLTAAMIVVVAAAAALPGDSPEPPAAG